MGTNQNYSTRVANIRRCKRIYRYLEQCLGLLQVMHVIYEEQDPKYHHFLEPYAGLLTEAQKAIEKFRTEMV